MAGKRVVRSEGSTNTVMSRIPKLPIWKYRLARVSMLDVAEAIWAMAGSTSNNVHPICSTIVGMARLWPVPVDRWSMVAVGKIEVVNSAAKEDIRCVLLVRYRMQKAVQ